MCGGVALRIAKRLQCGFRLVRNYYLHRLQLAFAKFALCAKKIPSQGKNFFHDKNQRAPFAISQTNTCGLIPVCAA
jgi:hypothetical protein